MLKRWPSTHSRGSVGPPTWNGGSPAGMWYRNSSFDVNRPHARISMIVVVCVTPTTFRFTHSGTRSARHSAEMTSSALQARSARVCSGALSWGNTTSSATSGLPSYDWLRRSRKRISAGRCSSRYCCEKATHFAAASRSRPAKVSRSTRRLYQKVGGRNVVLGVCSSRRDLLELSETGGMWVPVKAVIV